MDRFGSRAATPVVACALVVMALGASSVGCKKAREWTGTMQIMSGGPTVSLKSGGPCGPDGSDFKVWGDESGSVRIQKSDSGQFVTVQPPDVKGETGGLATQPVPTTLGKDSCTVFDVKVEDQGTKDSDGKPEFKGHVKLDCKYLDRTFKADMKFEDCR